jgi:hypothetical protein
MKKEIEEVIKAKFEFLTKEWMLSKPLMSRQKWNTTISYLGKKIAIELEVDWRDIGFSILVTKVIDGDLPGGYYIFNGETVRVPLFKIFEGQNQPETINDIKNIVKKNKNKDPEYLYSLIDKYKELIYGSGGNIITLSEELFKK